MPVHSMPMAMSYDPVMMIYLVTFTEATLSSNTLSPRVTKTTQCRYSNCSYTCVWLLEAVMRFWVPCQPSHVLIHDVTLAANSWSVPRAFWIVIFTSSRCVVRKGVFPGRRIGTSRPELRQWVTEDIWSYRKCCRQTIVSPKGFVCNLTSV